MLLAREFVSYISRKLVQIMTPGTINAVMPLYQQYVQDVMVELHTERVFLDPEIAKAASDGTINVLTYFANELRHGDRATPYAMVTAVGRAGDASAIPAAATAPIPVDLDDHEIAINSWLADDLGAKARVERA